MTTIREALGMAVENARAAKETRVARGSYVGVATIFGYRGEDVVAIVQPHEHDGPPIVAAASTMAAGFDLDLIALVLEVYVSEHRRNPHTGKRWQAGDMEDLAELGGVAKGWINDAMVVMVYNRAGDRTSITLPFRILDRNVDRVRWLEPVDGGELTGALDEALTKAMGAPPYMADADLVALYAGKSAEAVLALADLTTARFLDRHCEVALSAESGSERERIFTERGRGEWIK